MGKNTQELQMHNFAIQIYWPEKFNKIDKWALFGTLKVEQVKWLTRHNFATDG